MGYEARQAQSDDAQAFLSGLPQDVAHLRERIDWPYLVNFGILRLFSIMSEKEIYPYENIDNLTKFLERLIPSVYRDNDPQYQATIKKAAQALTVDTREEFAGCKLDVDACKALGIPYEEKIVYVDPVDRFGAIIDLFQRLNALVKLDRIEVFTGEKWDDYVKRMNAQAPVDAEEVAGNAEPKTA